MYTPSRAPAWHRDVIWCAGVVLVVATLIASAAFAWSRLAREDRAQPILRDVLRATLLPGIGKDSPALAVSRNETFAPGEPFEALFGSSVRIDPAEVASFAADDVVKRIAGVWTNLLLSEGAAALSATIEDPPLRRQVEAAVAGPAARLIQAELAAELLGAGLDDGSRLADWQLQARQEPNEPVRPVVGLFVFVDPDALQGLAERQIGEAVIAELAAVVLRGGADAGRTTITNVNLSARFEQAISQARDAVHQLFATLLADRVGDLDVRLAAARSVLLEDGEPTPNGFEGVLPAAELAGLSADEANERILDALATRAWQQGPDALASALEGDVRSRRLLPARDVVGAFSRAARNGAVRVAWFAGVVAALAALAMASLASGVGRLSRPGVAMALGALPGALLAWWSVSRLPVDVAPVVPAGARAEGVFGEGVELARYLATMVPAEAVTVVLRSHAVVAGVGLGLVLTAGIVMAIGAVRPRRRGYL